jgi:hypothetical protein
MGKAVLSSESRKKMAQQGKKSQKLVENEVTRAKLASQREDKKARHAAKIAKMAHEDAANERLSKII